jgi:hypothetical protein
VRVAQRRLSFEWLSELFAVDVRSLAALRIVLALLVLGELLFNQIPNLEIFYTDQGILPRDLCQDYLGRGYWSMAWLSGESHFIGLLMAANAIAAIGLLIGYQTRAVTAICLVLVWSLQIRNPLVLTAGHILLRMLLFWSLFLPLGAIWSVDSRIRATRKPAGKVLSVASAALLLQLAYMYFFAGLAKLNEHWMSGRGVELALQLEMYVKPLGHILRDYPAWLSAAAWATLILEIAGPVALFLPGVSKLSRPILMALFCILHWAIWMTISIGIFSLAAMAAWLIFVPGQWWDRLAAIRPAPGGLP